MTTIAKQLIGAAIFLGSAVLAASASAAVFPLKSDDLGLTHRYKTGDHSEGNNQKHGQDIIAVRPTGNGKWHDLTADNADRAVNKNHLIYGRKVYAMVSGTVAFCWRNAPENPTAGATHPSVDSGHIGVGGNNVVIRTDDGILVKVSHLITGTISATICPISKAYFVKPSGSSFPAESAVTNGARITKGQYLGLAGNSGNSSGPHLHVHMVKDNAPQEMYFERGQTTPFPNDTASEAGPWTKLNGNALPTGPILIWAPRSTGTWYVNNIPASQFQGWFTHMTDSGQMAESLACTDGGAFYDTQWLPAQGAWLARAGMSAIEMANYSNTYGMQGFSLYKWWYCGSVRSAIWRK